MPPLIWDPFALFEVLGVLPCEDESGHSHAYLIEQGAVRLALTIWPYDADVEVQVSEVSLPKPLFKYSLLGCPGIRVVDDKRGKFLEFAAPSTFTGRYDGYGVMPYGLRVWVDPQIFLEPFTYPS
ncbi:Ypar14, super integron cassette [Pseudomonas rubra]|uniref:Ypar14, super integron cassette n=1 Tax=Pseudomonas rubra TaxID=2942627 RepID=A0ABT5PAY4_9PSED|nr:Ypar14, super integron cassette [Pseudomonas rubra]MDD1015466.1 Ypar14, super integron cassette [Pseudomonas rubra]MDD1041280.1 Ypar14, super integron cassette [Pseudomonas rubra]MDD1153633.1 Ypar14, super integron cassette [Pseudomonas rubra]